MSGGSCVSGISAIALAGACRSFSLVWSPGAAVLRQQQAPPQPRRRELHRAPGLRNVERKSFSGRWSGRYFEIERRAVAEIQPSNPGIQQHECDCRRLRAAVQFREIRLLRSRIVTPSTASQHLHCSKRRNSSVSASAMESGGVFDLEKQFAQYGAYHSNSINVLIHMVFVWPILFSAFTLLAYTAPLAPQTPFMAALPYHEYMVLNYSFVAAAVYALFYICLERKSGSVAALLVLCCWIGANAAAQHVPYASGWKIVAISQVVCWSFQFLGHGVFEGRAPALLDNLAQAFLMAPYFVLLEVLHSLFHYEPYPDFTKNVQNKVGVQIAEFRSKKAKAKRME